MKTFYRLCLLFIAVSIAPAQDYQRDSAAPHDSSHAVLATRGYKDFFLVGGVGTGELVFVRAEVLFFRGLYATLGTGASFNPFEGEFFPKLTPQVDYGLTWKWYSLRNTPIVILQGSEAFWRGSHYDPATNSYSNVARKAGLLTVLVGAEHQTEERATIGVAAGGVWWEMSSGEKSDHLTIQFFGGLSF